jgi:hypothetical protein
LNLNFKLRSLHVLYNSNIKSYNVEVKFTVKFEYEVYNLEVKFTVQFNYEVYNVEVKFSVQFEFKVFQCT